MNVKAVAQLTREQSLVPSRLDDQEKSPRRAFITTRIRIMQIPSQVDDSTYERVRSDLSIDIQRASIIYNMIRSRVIHDSLHLSLNNVRDEMRDVCSPMTRGGDLRILRERLVQSIVWRLVATDSLLLDPANIDNLHFLVDRCLRITERMLYDVGRIENRRWRLPGAPGYSGPWIDEFTRTFEYPRVPRNTFRSLCDPTDSSRRDTPGECSNDSMRDWVKWEKEQTYLHHNCQVNPGASSYWEPAQPPDKDRDYVFFYKDSTRDPYSAIDRLFTAFTDYKQRNLLFCDQVIHALHLEALFFAKRKRSSDAGWINSLISSKPRGWLRIDYTWRTIRRDHTEVQFLGNRREPLFFKSLQISQQELQVGDHVIIYNHPAYDKASVEGAWRLENAVVVQTDTQLRLQGHGVRPSTIEQMRASMIRLFRGALDILQRRVKRISNPHLLEDPLFRTEEGGRVSLIRRVPPHLSSYVPRHQYADWWLGWDLDIEKGEDQIANSPERRFMAETLQKVVFGQDSSSGAWKYAFFPLFEPNVDGNRNPVRNREGKITGAHPTEIKPRTMFATWTWYHAEDPRDHDKLLVIRPTTRGHI